MPVRTALVASLPLLAACGDTRPSNTGETAPMGGLGGASSGMGGSAPSGDSAGKGGEGGAGGSQGGGASFPLGTYPTCATGIYTPSPNGNVFLNGSGFEASANLTLAHGQDGLTATYVDQNGAATTLHFSDGGNDTALLAKPVTTNSPAAALCVMGPGLSATYPASLAVSSGTMVYGGGVVYIELGGTVTADTGPCGSASGPGTLWLLCEDGPAPPSVASATQTMLVPGAYTCTSQVGTYYEAQGMKQFLTAGGPDGKLALSQSGAHLVVEYASDKYVTGAMHLTATTATTALADVGQSLSAPCDVPVGTGSLTPEALPLGFGSLLSDGSTLFVAFAGAMPDASSCAGAKKAGTLICVKD